MKPNEKRLERLESVLREAHRARPEREAGEGWLRNLMAEIRASSPENAGPDVFALLGGLAPALAAAALILFVGVWISSFGTYDEMAIAMLADVPGNMAFPVAGL